MKALITGFLAFFVTMGGAWAGMALAPRLPSHHKTKETKDLIQVSIAVVATLSALVAGLLTNAAKASFDARQNEIRQASARIIMLDRTLDHLGTSGNEARALLRKTVDDAINAVWSEGRINPAEHPMRGMEPIRQLLASIQTTSDGGRYLKSRALQLTDEIENLALDIVERRAGGIPWPFVMVLTFWFGVIFLSFGLFAPRNAIVYVVLTTSSLCVATALYLIAQMDQPYSGFIQLSSTPLTDALKEIDR